MSQNFYADHLPLIMAQTGLMPQNLIESLFVGRDRTAHTMSDILSRQHAGIDEQFWLEKITEYIQNQMYKQTEIQKLQSIPIFYIPVPGSNNAERIPHPQEDIYPGIQIARKGEEFHSRELAWKLPLGNNRYSLLILNYDPRQVIDRNYYPQEQKQVRQYWFHAAQRQGWEINPQTPTNYYWTTPHQWFRALTNPPRQWTRMTVRKWARELAYEQGIDLYAYCTLCAFGWSNISQEIVERQGIKETHADRAYRAKRKLEQEFSRQVILNLPIYKTDPGIEEPYKKEIDPLEASARLTEEEQIGLTYWENIIRTAVERGASDIHITPIAGEKGDASPISIRLREQGVLYHYVKIPEPIARFFYQHVHRGTGKESGNTAALDDLRRKYIHPVTQKQVDLRISITSGIHRYPQIVIRILDQERLPRNIQQLRLNHHQTELFEEALNLVDGLLLVVGETGSGKSSTLYCSMNTVREKNPFGAITSIEDPIEYELPFTSYQVQIDENRNIHYPNALTQMMRNDFNTILVGEIRNLETANTALSLALSGHQMMTTLHANSCADSISRLYNMGADMDILARVLRFVIAQRLIGIPCSECCIYCETHPDAHKIRTTQPHRILTLTDFRTTYLPSIANVILNEHLPRWEQLHPNVDRQGAWFAKGDGCPHCHNIGYTGRRAVMEMLYLKEEDQSLVRERQLQQIEAKQQKRGCYRVPINAWEMAWSGQTAVQEAEKLTNKLEGHTD